ncbi:flagellar motor switch protein FliN [Sansalvadorimonas sp. 2012CJ34-2]|uniref:Flagellar motor switch protein FliN n=1 Tax=Parendozoicomonas callyspongiae TaxID=2942213 RepID=A0ABT0PFM2_9GAMM|nr:flagellar motor switch protein FliN [Sansalvadorimonas sp. 2012CJ34-2]MCL6270130.1 flagellar motor switch protein FliN [Sansalvadorimonas sp. 2012CJ34-2]
MTEATALAQEEETGIVSPAFEETVAEQVTPDLGVILDIPVVMSLEVGSTELTVNELLSMGSGTVIELNRHTGDPLDVKVNGKLVGRGEVVESNSRYGIRLTEVVNVNERLGPLG